MYDLTTQQVPVATGQGFNSFEQIGIISPQFLSNHHQRFQSIYCKMYKCLCDFGRFNTYLHAKLKEGGGGGVYSSVNSIKHA